MTTREFESAYSKNYGRWVAMARRQLAKTPALKSETPEDVVQAIVSHLMSPQDVGNGWQETRYLMVPGGEELNAYMSGCIKNRIHDLVSRAVDIQVPAHAEVGYLEEIDKPTTPLDRAETSELRATIQKVINTFPTVKAREALRLVYLEDWTQQEVEAKLGYSSLRSTCFRFRERLAMELEGG